MSTKYEKNFYLASLAEGSDKYIEMAIFLENMIKQKDKDLNSEERDLLSTAYKKSVFYKRNALITITAYEAREKKKENSNVLPYITQYNSY